MSLKIKEMIIEIIDLSPISRYLIRWDNQKFSISYFLEFSAVSFIYHVDRVSIISTLCYVQNIFIFEKIISHSCGHVFSRFTVYLCTLCFVGLS